jgi:hypothetical protein
MKAPPTLDELSAHDGGVVLDQDFGGNLTLVLRHTLAIALAVFILFEEWGWEPLSRLVGNLACLPIWARTERRIRAMSPRASLIVLVLPWILLLPLKLVTLWLLATGQIALAMTAVVLGKIIGTAIVARLFSLTKPALMRVAWFASWYMRWTLTKDRLLLHARGTETWIRMRRLKALMWQRVAYWRATP